MNNCRIDPKLECKEIWRSHYSTNNYRDYRDGDAMYDGKLNIPFTKAVCTSYNATPITNNDGYNQLRAITRYPVPVQEYNVKHVPVETSTAFISENVPAPPQPSPQQCLINRRPHQYVTPASDKEADIRNEVHSSQFLSSNQINGSNKVGSDQQCKKPNPVRPRISVSKPLGWKRAYIQPVKDAKNRERIGIIVLGPKGPEVYSKTELVGNATPSKSTSLKLASSRSTEKEWKSDNNDSPLSPQRPKGSHSKGDNNAIDEEKVREANFKERNGSGDTNINTPDNMVITRKNEAGILSERDGSVTGVEPSTPKSGDTTKRNPTVHVYRASLQQQNPLQQPKFERKHKTTTSSQISSSSKQTPPPSRRRKSTHGHNFLAKEMEQWLNENLKRKFDANNKTTFSSEERMKLLKEALPSVAAASEADHLQQLRTCITKFLDAMERRSDEQFMNATSDALESDASGVRCQAQKLIDVVSYPLRKLTSNIAVNATQSVTDALLASDEETTTDHHVCLEKLKDVRSKQIQNILNEVKDLEKTIRIIDRIQQQEKNE